MPVELAWREVGDGPPLVILHGLFGSSRNWKSIAEALADSHRVFAVDLRNHGDSGWAGGMGYDLLAEDVAAFLDARGLDSAALVGHSMGGKAAMMLALCDPTRVDALVAVDIAPAAYTETLIDYIHALQDVDVGHASRRAEVDEDLEGLIPDPPTRTFLLQNLMTGEDGRMRWRVNLEALNAGVNDLHDFRPPPGAIYNGPALIVAGGNSDYIRPVHGDAIRALFPLAETVTIPDAGHRVHAERPEAFVTALRRFLAG